MRDEIFATTKRYYDREKCSFVAGLLDGSVLSVYDNF